MNFPCPSQKNKQVELIDVEESPDAAEPAGGFVPSPLQAEVAENAFELQAVEQLASRCVDGEVTPPKRKGIGQDQLESTEKRPCKRRMSFKAVAAKCSEMIQAQKLVVSNEWPLHSFQIGGRYFCRAIRADEESNLMNSAYYSASDCEEEPETQLAMEVPPPQHCEEEPATQPAMEVPPPQHAVETAKEVPPCPAVVPEAPPILRAADQKKLRQQKRSESSKKNGSEKSDKKKNEKKKKDKKNKGKKNKGKKNKGKKGKAGEVAVPAEGPVAPPGQEVPAAIVEEPPVPSRSCQNPQLVSKAEQKELRQLLAIMARVLVCFLIFLANAL